MKYDKYEHEKDQPKPHTFEVVKIISETKKIRGQGRRPGPGMKRVQATVRIDGDYPVTRHLDVPK